MGEKMRDQSLMEGELPEVEASSAGAVDVEGKAATPRIVKVRPTLTEMEVGDEVSFPVAQMKSVRAQCSELGVILDRRYQTRVSRPDRTIIVLRTA